MFNVFILQRPTTSANSCSLASFLDFAGKMIKISISRKHGNNSNLRMISQRILYVAYDILNIHFSWNLTIFNVPKKSNFSVSSSRRWAIVVGPWSCWIQRRSSSPRHRSFHRWGSWSHCFLLTYLLLVNKQKHCSLLLQNKNPPLHKQFSERNKEVPASPILELLLPSLGRWEFCKWVLFSLSLHNEIGQQQHFQKGIGESQEPVVLELLPRPNKDFGNWVLF